MKRYNIVNGQLVITEIKNNENEKKNNFIHGIINGRVNVKSRIDLFNEKFKKFKR